MRQIEVNLDIDKIYNKHHILKITELIDLSNLKFGYQSDHDLLPTKLAESAKSDHRNNILIKTHPYKTRNKRLPNLPAATHNLYQKSFLYQSLVKYNSLPNSIKQIGKQCSFVRECKKWLINNY